MAGTKSGIRFEREPAWVAGALRHAARLLAKHPPSFPAALGRQEALMLLDGPMHLSKASGFRSTCNFCIRRIERAIREIETTRIRRGGRLWRLYNHGFVLRTPSATIGFDLTGGWRGSNGQFYGLSPTWLSRLAAQIDVLSISHRHGDHLDPPLRDLLWDRNVPILVPPGVYDDCEGHPCRIPAWKPALHGTRQHKTAAIQGLTGKPIEHVAYAGHQGAAMENLTHLFRVNKDVCVVHTGDQSGDLDWDWLDRIGDHHAVDLLIVNCWTNDLWRLIRGVRPAAVVTGHEMELAHPIEGREGYCRSLQRFRDHDELPSYVLCWGESVRVPPRRGGRAGKRSVGSQR